MKERRENLRLPNNQELKVRPKKKKKERNSLKVKLLESVFFAFQLYFCYFQFHLLIAGSTRAVQHVLNAIGYESTKPAGGKPGDQSPVAMEMEPEDVEWLKVKIDLPFSLLHSSLSLLLSFPSFPDILCSFSSFLHTRLSSFSSSPCSSGSLSSPLCPLSLNYV